MPDSIIRDSIKQLGLYYEKKTQQQQQQQH